MNDNHSRLLVCIFELFHPKKNLFFLKILCDASCETGVPFRNISCVIDTGITLEVNLF